MAEIKWIKITTNMFESKQIKQLHEMPGTDLALIIYLRFLVKAKRHKNRRFFYSITGRETLDDALLGWVFEKDSDEIKVAMESLEMVGLINRSISKVEVFRYWESEQRNRNTPEYIQWRKQVFERDGWKCRQCGQGGKLNAHHNKPWATNKDLRFCVENGITLCEICHKKIHKTKG